MGLGVGLGSHLEADVAGVAQRELQHEEQHGDDGDADVKVHPQPRAHTRRQLAPVIVPERRDLVGGGDRVG